MKKQTGFSLIELLIVLVIIGILAGLAIPRYMAYTTRSKQTEAKGLLNQIYLSERAYFQSHDEYWIPDAGIFADRNNPYAFDTLGVEIMKSARYRYEIAGDAEHFTVTATADHLDDDPPIDQWEMDQTGDLKVISDDSILR
ncbi:MAG: prepilin-type N-terminal cleavage/methylation domain-containing protein [candidate division Zixibacteria bacterium]|nr:prepilin-type N-terminal cleavage/methylation domain-containing protein [candidate division Zixibacteria bacterium]